MYDVFASATCRLLCMRYAGVAFASGAAEKQNELWDVRSSLCDEIVFAELAAPAEA